MRTKERFQGFVAGIITACLLLAALPVIAATFEKTITVTYIGPAELNVYLDGNLAQTVELDGNALPQTITVPLNYASQLKLEMKASAIDGSQKYGLANGIFE